ncbi:alcohol dehydrogenase family protein [Marimonas lutisalis]|uniref:alcohol dehydrogenase family protein n=1 Tax=Marimonas lutisalis TaxID=2545756 RepID=UPI0010F65616|nr:alcohol dehydrogenase family protein [Marimonas lutisalis]
MHTGTTMSGVVLTGHGGPDMLSWRDDLPIPRAGKGDVVVRVHAAAVNNTDINTRLAWYSKGDAEAGDATWSGAPMTFPRIQGADVCGTIVAVGDGVDPARIGERILIEPCLVEADGQRLERPWYLGSECDGGFAQYTRVASRHAHRIASDLTDVQLASFPCSYSTAENMLTRADVGPGDTVLVTGASGGVGSAALQLARARGARVFAVTHPSKAPSLVALGADKTVDRGADLVQALGPDSVDVVIDLVAGPTWPTLLDVLRPGGRYSVAGAIAGPHVTLDVRTLYLKDLSLFGCTVLDPGVFAALVRRIERGEIAPLVAATYPLRQIAEAQAAFGEKGYIGKIVLEIG